jgi:hypothetical protein
MAEKLAVRRRTHRYLAPFGGITRIRFKGFVQDVSAVSAPPLFWKVRRKTEEVKGKSWEGRIKKEELGNRTPRPNSVSSLLNS